MITHACPDFNTCLTKLPLELGLWFVEIWVGFAVGLDFIAQKNNSSVRGC